eukprot:366256-Chlamydomonas_euryale.AAC.6
MGEKGRREGGWGRKGGVREDGEEREGGRGKLGSPVPSPAYGKGHGKASYPVPFHQVLQASTHSCPMQLPRTLLLWLGRTSLPRWLEWTSLPGVAARNLLDMQGGLGGHPKRRSCLFVASSGPQPL